VSGSTADPAGDALAAVERRLSAGPGLTVSSDLVVTVDGTELTVSSFTDLLRIEVPSVRALATLGRRHRERVATLGSLLSAADLTAAIVVGRRRVATVGADVTPGPLARLLGLGPFRVHVGGLTTALLRAP